MEDSTRDISPGRKRCENDKVHFSVNLTPISENSTPIELTPRSEAEFLKMEIQDLKIKIDELVKEKASSPRTLMVSRIDAATQNSQLVLGQLKSIYDINKAILAPVMTVSEDVEEIKDMLLTYKRELECLREDIAYIKAIVKEARESD